MAESLPEPGPFTLTSIFLRPKSIAVLAAAAAACCAANGVFFLDPLKPSFPAVEEATTLP